MAKIIGLSGPQGGGKTTLLDGLAGEGIVVDDFKVARHVQQVLGWKNLEPAVQDLETMKMFQMMILGEKIKRELMNAERTDANIILVERTFADILAYARLWASKLVDTGKIDIFEFIEFIMNFTGECRNAQRFYDGNIILPMMPHVKFEADPHRASEADVDQFSKYLNDFFTLNNPTEVPTFKVSAAATPDRVQQVKQWIVTL